MKKFILIILISNIIFNCNHAFAFKNEPEGFRGIAWGTNLFSLSGINCIDIDKNNKSCTRINDKQNIGDAEITHIRYNFYKNLFESVGFITNGYSNSRSILNSLNEQFGNGEKHNQYIESYNWIGENTYISYKEENINHKAYIFFLSIKMQKLINEDKKNSAIKSKEDF